MGLTFKYLVQIFMSGSVVIAHELMYKYYPMWELVGRGLLGEGHLQSILTDKLCACVCVCVNEGRLPPRGRMYELWISPLIAFIFYPPFKLKKISMYEARSGLSGQPNAFKVIHTFFYV